MCHFNYFVLYIYMLPFRSVGRSNFDKGLHDLIMLIKKRYKTMIEVKLLCYIYLYIYICNIVVLVKICRF